MKTNKIFIGIMVLVILIPIVSAGVTMPYPSSLKLEKGESGLFKFQVQSNDPGDLECNYDISEGFPLEIKFTGGPQTSVDGGKSGNVSIKVVEGVITAPEDIAYGSYTADFCATCRSVDESSVCINCVKPDDKSGASINTRYCGLSITAEVVEDRTQANMFEMPKEPLISLNMVIGLLVILIVLGLIIYNVRRLNKHNVKRFNKK